MKKTLLGVFLILFICGGNVIAEDGLTDTQILVGTALDLSGPAAAVGISCRNGMIFRADEVNEAGGIHGRKIKLVMEDHAYKPQQAITVVNKMIHRDKVFAFAGIVGTPTGLAVKPLISKKKIPQVVPIAAASAFFDPHDRYSFGGFTPYLEQGKIIVKYFVEEKGKKNVGILFQDDSYGSAVLNGVKTQLKVYGMELKAKESYKRGAAVFSTQIAKLKKAGCDLVILATIIRSTVGALSEAHKLGWDVDFVGVSGTYNHYIPYLLNKAGIPSEGYYASGYFPYIDLDHPNPKARKFYNEYTERFGKKPDLFTCMGWLAMDVFIEAAQRAGRQLTREKLIDALETFRNREDGVFDGSPLTYTSTSHKGMESGMIMMLKKDGSWQKIKDYK
jgi:branched-chain amino acid transport system substrate-binding protein